MILALSLGLVLLLTFGSNPVYSILTLISSSLCLGFILLTYGLQFVSFLIVLIYIGAVSVLFLFVVMMINFRLNFSQFPLTETFFFWLLSSTNFVSLINSNYKVITLNSRELTNFESLGCLLYQTNEVQLLLIVSLVLFVAMLGAISLTYIASENYRTQHIPTQTSLQINKSYRLTPYQSNFFSGFFLVFCAGLEKHPLFFALLVSFFIISMNIYANYKHSTLRKNWLIFPAGSRFLLLFQILICFIHLGRYFGGIFFFNFGLIGLLMGSILFYFEAFSIHNFFQPEFTYFYRYDIIERIMSRHTGKFKIITTATGAGALGYTVQSHNILENQSRGKILADSKFQETKYKVTKVDLKIGWSGYEKKTEETKFTNYKNR